MKPNEIVQTKNYAAKMHGPGQAPSPGQQQWWWWWGMLSLTGSSLTCGECLSPTVSGNGSGKCWVFLSVNAAANRQATCNWVLSRLWLHTARLRATPAAPFPKAISGSEAVFSRLWAPRLEKMMNRGPVVTMRSGKPQLLPSSRPEKEWQTLCFPYCLKNDNSLKMM